MRSRNDLRKGKLVAEVLAGAWRSSDFPPLLISESDLDEVTPLLNKSGAAALSWRRLRTTHLQNSPSSEVLHQAYRLQSLQAEIQEQKIEKLFRLLRQASVEAVLAKGWAAGRLYSETALRPSGDIDICVRPQQFELVLEVLSVPEARDCWVDLHKSFSEIDDRPIEEIFSRSNLIDLGAEQIRVLGPEDHLALLCLHLLKHGAWRPLWLCDISVALESLPSTFDWRIFLGDNKQRARWIACAIGLAHKLLAARIEHVPLEPRQLEVPDWLVPSVLNHWSSLFPGDHLPIHAAPLMANNIKEGRNIIKGIVERWPDPITATYNVKGQFNNFPRFPYQLADFIRMATRFMIDLPAKLQRAR